MKSLVLAGLISLIATAAHSNTVPNIWGEWAWPFTDPVHVMVSPSGSGTPLTSATFLGGAVVDATVRVQLWVEGGTIEDPQEAAPVANFPGEDIWLEFPGLDACWPWMTADGPTDADGWFTFSGTLSLGGWNDPADPLSFPVVVVMGTPLLDQNGQLIRPTLVINSPDIDGDLAVNLTDVSIFAQDYYSPYVFRSDFNGDGVLNLTDVARLASFYGDSCP